MPTVTLVLLIIAIVLIVAVIVLYFLGKKAEKKKAEQDEQIAAAAQSVTMLIIDKKKLRLKDAGLPAAVVEQTPKLITIDCSICVSIFCCALVSSRSKILRISSSLSSETLFSSEPESLSVIRKLPTINTIPTSKRVISNPVIAVILLYMRMSNPPDIPFAFIFPSSFFLSRFLFFCCSY